MLNGQDKYTHDYIEEVRTSLSVTVTLSIVARCARNSCWILNEHVKVSPVLIGMGLLLHSSEKNKAHDVTMDY